jgi:hypothetical protein
MGRGPPHDPGPPDRTFHYALENGLVQVVPATLVGCPGPHRGVLRGRPIAIPTPGLRSGTSARAPWGARPNPPRTEDRAHAAPERPPDAGPNPPLSPPAAWSRGPCRLSRYGPPPGCSRSPSLGRAGGSIRAGATPPRRAGGHQAWDALEGVQRGPYFLAGQDDRQPLRVLRAHDIVEPRQIQLEYRTVAEQECAQRPVLGGGPPLSCRPPASSRTA